MSELVEWQCDGIVGPTHNYAGLSHGNVASESNAMSISNPRQAALQGLEKMAYVAGLGIPQLMLPPPMRPSLSLLQQLGFSGGMQQMLDAAWETDPMLLYAAWSASSMWAANTATASPAPDTPDGKLHLTPANLASTLHRQQEAMRSMHLLKAIFGAHAMVHPPLPACLPLTDEGAANQMRLTQAHGKPGVEVYVYGRRVARPGDVQPVRYPARQTREAVEAIARRHGIPAEKTVFAQQNPEAIDAGVFHNDVIAMSNENLLIYHEKAFLNEEAFLAEIRQKLAPVPLIAVRITQEEISLADVVKSYFFNSQLLSLPEGGMAVVAPAECSEIPAVRRVLEAMRDDNANPITQLHFLDVRESMRNGGGPACLRLRIVMPRVPMTEAIEKLRWTPEKNAILSEWITRHYPDRLTPEMLRDTAFATEMMELYAGLNELVGVEAAGS